MAGARPGWLPGGFTSGQQLINDLREVVKVDVPGHCLQWVAQGLDLVLARSIGEEAELNGTARLRFAHRGIVALAGMVPGGRWGFLEVPLILVPRIVPKI